MAHAEGASRSVVLFCQQGLGDPLVAPLALEYMLRLAGRYPELRILVITEEPPDSSPPAALLARLAEKGVEWMPLSYDVRGWQWGQRLRNLLRMAARARTFGRRWGKPWLLGYLSFGASYAIACQFLGLGRCAALCFEPHSRYMVEMGLWKRTSAKALLTAWFERMLMRRAHVLVVPTTAGRELVRAHAPQVRVLLQGIAIDTRAGAFDAGARARHRHELGLGDATVIAYVGKFGGIYHSPGAYAAFMRAMLAADPALRFLIIASHEACTELRREIGSAALHEAAVLHGPVPPEELAGWLSAADVGVVAIPPTPSQAFRTPVKTAHYWAAGLPVVIARGISDDHALVAAEGTGIVVEDLPVEGAQELRTALAGLMNGNRVALRERCMRAAREHRGMEAMDHALETALGLKAH